MMIMHLFQSLIFKPEKAATQENPIHRQKEQATLTVRPVQLLIQPETLKVIRILRVKIPRKRKALQIVPEQVKAAVTIAHRLLIVVRKAKVMVTVNPTHIRPEIVPPILKQSEQTPQKRKATAKQQERTPELRNPIHQQ